MNWRICKKKFPPNVFTCIVSTYRMAQTHSTGQMVLAFQPSGRSFQHPFGFFNYLLKVSGVSSREYSNWDPGTEFLAILAGTKMTHVYSVTTKWECLEVAEQLTEPRRDDMKQPHDWEHDFASPTAGFINGVWPVGLLAYAAQLLALYFPKL